VIAKQRAGAGAGQNTSDEGGKERKEGREQKKKETTEKLEIRRRRTMSGEKGERWLDQA